MMFNTTFNNISVISWQWVFMKFVIMVKFTVEHFKLKNFLYENNIICKRCYSPFKTSEIYLRNEKYRIYLPFLDTIVDVVPLMLQSFDLPNIPYILHYMFLPQVLYDYHNLYINVIYLVDEQC